MLLCDQDDISSGNAAQVSAMADKLSQLLDEPNSTCADQPSMTETAGL